MYYLARFQEVLWRGILQDGMPTTWLNFPTVYRAKANDDVVPARLNFLILKHHANLVARVAVEVANHKNWVDQLNLFF